MKRLLGVILSALLLIVVACGGGGGSVQAPARELPPGTPLAHGKVFGYYGDVRGQVPRTCDHVNMLWVWGWGDWEYESEQNLFEAKVCGIDFVVMGLPQSFDGNAELRIEQRLTLWISRGLLPLEFCVTPIDEPDTEGDKSEAQLRAWAAMMDRIKSRHAELANLCYAISYAAHGRPAIDVFKYIAWNDYGLGDRVLGQPLEDLKALLKPHQRVLLVPGGADPWRQPIAPFFVKVQEDPQVVGVLAFLFRKRTDERTGESFKGIEDNGMLQSYCLAGKKIKVPYVPTPVCP